MNGVTMIVSTWERPADLKVTLASLAVQTVLPHEVIVVHEPGGNLALMNACEDVVLSFGMRFRFEPTPTRWNDYGLSAKDWATRTLATGDVVGWANGDNYYTPNYIEEMTKPIVADAADFTYCDYLMQQVRYDPQESGGLKRVPYSPYKVWLTRPIEGQIDGGGWLCRRSTYLDNPFPGWLTRHMYNDSKYVEFMGDKCRMRHVDGVLWCHN